MTWGGFLNKEGSQYYIFLRNADKTIEFLEEIKKYLEDEEKNSISKTIEIITSYINKLSENESKDLDT